MADSKAPGGTEPVMGTTVPEHHEAFLKLSWSASMMSARPAHALRGHPRFPQQPSHGLPAHLDLLVLGQHLGQVAVAKLGILLPSQRHDGLALLPPEGHQTHQPQPRSFLRIHQSLFPIHGVILALQLEGTISLGYHSSDLRPRIRLRPAV